MLNQITHSSAPSLIQQPTQMFMSEYVHDTPVDRLALGVAGMSMGMEVCCEMKIYPVDVFKSYSLRLPLSSFS